MTQFSRKHWQNLLTEINRTSSGEFALMHQTSEYERARSGLYKASRVLGLTISLSRRSATCLFISIPRVRVQPPMSPIAAATIALGKRKGLPRIITPDDVREEMERGQKGA